MSVVDCGGWGDLGLFTLTFDSSPIKGEGDMAVGLSFLPAHPPPLWIADQVCNDVAIRCMGSASPCGYCLEASMTGSPCISA